ncbi:N-acetyltransferase [Flavobacteriaceae bacterium]|nr:N-acetyltransferase [Flavobacteriaceae bacterium]
MIHPLAYVESNRIGENTDIWQFCVILKKAVIGNNCNINCNVFVENDVIIGNGVTIKPGVQLWDGIRIENEVFIGPNVTFVNDKYPRSKVYPEFFQRVTIKNNASIGANATVLGGLKIGSYSIIGAGAVITKDVPSRSLVIGNPGRIVGWLNNDGTKMKSMNGFYIDNIERKWVEENNNLFLLDD